MALDYIPLNRQLQKHWLWDEKPFSKGQAWIDLLMLANYKDNKTPYKGQVITCKRGDVNMSISALAKRWGWSRHKAKNFLTLLESDNMVSVKSTTHRTTITIENYEVFNNQCTTKRPTRGQQGDITNKDNKENNIYSRSGGYVPTPLTPPKYTPHNDVVAVPMPDEIRQKLRGVF